jgi:hypothetical protein
VASTAPILAHAGPRHGISWLAQVRRGVGKLVSLPLGANGMHATEGWWDE